MVSREYFKYLVKRLGELECMLSESEEGTTKHEKLTKMINRYKTEIQDYKKKSEQVEVLNKVVEYLISEDWENLNAERAITDDDIMVLRGVLKDIVEEA